MKKRRSLKIIICLIVLAGLTALLIWGNNSIEITEIKVTDEEIPDGFSSFRIAQISDLHNAEFGNNNSRLIKKLKRTEPDIIVITGDMIDSKKTDVDIASSFAAEAVKIAPVYYVTGNHEGNNRSEYEKLRSELENAGVILLENRFMKIEKGDESIIIAGADDPVFLNDFEYVIDNIIEENEEYTVLLAHRPEYIDIYEKYGADMVFSGHAHGGQFRIPFIGGVVAPGQGFFPEYDSGKYTEGDTVMIVSRGLGNSIIPLRVNNRPEIIVVELCCE